MKKIAFYLFLLGLIVSLEACKSDQDAKVESTEEEYYDFKAFTLKDYDIPAMIMLPDETANIGASTRPEIIHAPDDFKWELLVGPNFHMIIDDWGDDRTLIASEKSRLSGLPFYQIKYLVDDPELIVYERILKVDGEKSAPKSVGLEHKSYHVYGQKVIDGITYVFRSRDEGYEKIIIDLMAKSVKSVKSLKETNS